jgi:hypothetical protein
MQDKEKVSNKPNFILGNPIKSNMVQNLLNNMHLN